MIRPLLQPLGDSVVHILTAIKQKPEMSVISALVGVVWDRVYPVLGAAFPVEPKAVMAIGGLMLVDFILGIQCAKAEGRPINSHTSRAMSTPKLIGYTWLYVIGALSVGSSGETWIYSAILGWITGKEVWSGWEKLHRMGKVSTAPDEIELLKPLSFVFGKKAGRPQQPYEYTGKGDDPNV